jgi:leucyl aminopeptidase
MPVTSAVTTLNTGGAGSAGDYLRAVKAGRCESADLLAVAVGSGGAVANDATLDSLLGISQADIVAAAQLSGTAGQTVSTVAAMGDVVLRVVFVGVGDRSASELRKAGGELARQMRPGEFAVADMAAGLTDVQLSALVEGILLGSYRYSERSADADTAGKRCDVRMLVPPGATGVDDTVSRAATIAAAVALARDLGNTPPVRKCPQWLAEAAAEVATTAGLDMRVWDERQLAQAGFGGIAAVGSGSARPPRLIQLRYAPPGVRGGSEGGRPPRDSTARRHVVLVGKGVTFDSGGLSLKRGDGMKLMKTDMAGGGAVIAVMSALAELGVADQVTGLIAAAENLPSGSAFRPGDVISQYGGRTVEVRNTDAEGRLMLADAIAYADAELAPDQIVDVATLTGAARNTFGGVLAALYSTSDELAASLLAAGESSGDRLWRMPLPEDYANLLDSPVADLANIPASSEGGGSIIAALFLRGFAGRRPWAHLDIAGPARSSADGGELTAGATGFGVKLLLNWLAGSTP